MREVELSQLESYFKLQNLLNPQFPLPKAGGWAASWELLLTAVKEAFRLGKENLVILEAGSGVSTVVFGYLIKNYFPKGKLFSLEHDYDFYLKTKEELSLHGLEVDLLYAPLKPYSITGKEWLWYDIKELKELLKDKEIDLLFIDGPPQDVNEEARYPVLPLLKPFLAKDFVLILDDACREGEKRASLRWKEELEVYEDEFFQTEKGALILRQVEVKERPFFSVCVPTYNRAHYLKEALESVLSQTYKNYEVIVYDDGSTDSTYQVVKGFKSEKIKYFRGDKNRGRPFARNRCIELSKGDWIVWLDDDDILNGELLSKYAVAINSFSEVSLFHPRIINIKEEGKGSYQVRMPYDYYKNKPFLLRTLARKTPIPNPSVCLKREVYLRFGGYSEEFLRAQDYHFWTRVLPFIEIKGLLTEGLTYRIHQNNVSGNLLKSDLSYESVIKREFIEIVPLEEIYSFDKENALSLFSKDLTLHQDFFNASYYSWLAGKGFKAFLKDAGLTLNRKELKLFLRALSFLKKGNYQAATSLSEKLPLFFRFLVGGAISLKVNDANALYLLKRAALLNPLFDFSSLVEDDSVLKEISAVKERLLKPWNSLELRKEEFISLLTGGILEDICLRYS